MTRERAADTRLPLFADPPGGTGDAPVNPDTPHAALSLDAEARHFAADPRHNVILEASAGTGKTSVLVDRYVNLLAEGVDPANILAITFTRKAAAEMRERIVHQLRRAAAESPDGLRRWRDLRDRLSDIAIGTIDAFCLSLLRDFPLEADLDPAFTMADETEVPRLMEETLERVLRICQVAARDDEDVAIVFARLSRGRIQDGLAHLLERRLVAPAVLDRYLASGPADLTAVMACRRAAERLRDILQGVPGGLTRFIEDGPVRHPRFSLLAKDLRRLATLPSAEAGAIHGVLGRVRDHFCRRSGEPRKRLTSYRAEDAVSREAFRRHAAAVRQLAPAVKDVAAGLERDLNVVLARGVRRMFAIARTEYRRTLDAHAVVDFPEALIRALELLRRMDEFSQSRFRLDARYRHVLVDELQDTSRAQWELVALLIQSWGEGAGVAYEGPIPPSIFVVGDRKQSIYRFRDADVAVLESAARYIQALRPDVQPRRSISRSFRASPALLRFVNDVCDLVPKAPGRPDAFRYDDRDRFPIDGSAFSAGAARDVMSLGIAAADRPRSCAVAVAGEIARLLGRAIVRDKTSGLARAAQAGDVAILFRSREGHQDFERALEERKIPSYVYKGLGFFEADEIQDACALLRYLADPASDLRAAAFLRSRFVRLSDAGLAGLAPNLADALANPGLPAGVRTLTDEDQRVVARLRAAVPRWLDLVDRIPPAELLDQVIAESAYAFEMAGPRHQQARENLKKLRGLIRRIQNRGYATLVRIAEYVDRLAAGDESNAIVDAIDAVNLMTIHASKGLEFPIVFVVQIARGTGSSTPAMRVLAGGEDDPAAVSIADFRAEADTLDAAAEVEETKRLLYVALTRARDRLYLASVIEDGEIKPGRGSLAGVMPASLLQLFGRAARNEQDSLTWTAHPHAPPHVMRVCPPALPSPIVAEQVSTTPGGRAAADDFARLPGIDLLTRHAVTGSRDQANSHLEIAIRGRDPGLRYIQEPGSNRLLGTLVHRLLRRRIDPLLPEEEVARHGRLLIRDEESAGPDDLESTVAEAARAYLAVRRHAAVRALLEEGACWFEMPFSMRVERPAPGILRGVMDCLVRRPDGTVTVLEFKTGVPRPEHRLQIEEYRRVAATLFRGATARAVLVYVTAQGEGAAPDVVLVE